MLVDHRTDQVVIIILAAADVINIALEVNVLCSLVLLGRFCPLAWLRLQETLGHEGHYYLFGNFLCILLLSL